MHVLAVLVALVSFAITPLAHARAVDTWFVGLDELMRMDENKRLSYLREVRNIVLEFEVNTEGALPESTSSAFQSLGLMPEAYAASDNARLKCNFAKEHWQRLNTTEFCILNSSAAKAGCPEGYKSLGDSGVEEAQSTFYRRQCYSQMYAGKASTKAPPPSWMKLETKCNGVINCKTVEGKPVCTCTPEKGFTPAPAKPDKKTETKPAPAAKSETKAEIKPKAAPKAKPEPKPNAKPAAKPEEKPAAKPDDGAKPSCEALVPECGDRESFREQFYATKKACIYAGNISRYRGNKPTRSGCVGKSSISLSQGKEFKCVNGVACNPLVFCVPDVNKNEAYCTKRGGEATKECDTIASQDPKCLNDLLANAGVVKREAWDRFLKDLRSVCTTDEASAKFHCRECGIMYRRIFALNTEYFGSLCEKAAVPGAPAKDSGSATKATAEVTR